MNKIGIIGENIAARYLLSSGYKLIERNHREGFDEIDIIGLDIFNRLIFFEVKALSINRSFPSLFQAEDHFSSFKTKRIVRACKKFAAKHSYLIDDDLGWQIDLIAISVKKDGFYDLRHYKNCI